MQPIHGCYLSEKITKKKKIIRRKRKIIVLLIVKSFKNVHNL